MNVSDPVYEVPFPPRPADVDERTALLLKALDERILVLDGATGTALQGVHLTAEDFGGPELEGCNENLCATRPDVVDGVHERYLAVGCDVVETNSFGGTPPGAATSWGPTPSAAPRWCWGTAASPIAPSTSTASRRRLAAPPAPAIPH